MPYLIIDLEMTGNDVTYHDIIQIGAVLANDNWDKISEYESLVYPENRETISKLSEEIHGISIYDLDDAPMAYDVFEEFENWIYNSLKRPKTNNLFDIVVCGQSVINDIHFLRVKYDDLNIKWPFSSKLLDLLSLSFIMYKIFDSNNIKRPKSYSLKSVGEFFYMEREDMNHNALEDSKLTFECFKKYFEIAGKIKLVL